MVDSQFESSYVNEDKRFISALKLFNSAEWYAAHDAFEELWHETSGPERSTLQGLLQVAVAQVHLERGNRTGAMILYGEGLGRLKRSYSNDLGLDLDVFCTCIEERLAILHRDGDPESCTVPVLLNKINRSLIN